MRIVVTGAFGFLGGQVSTALLRRGAFCGKLITELVLADRVVPPDSPVTQDERVEVVPGDLLDSLDTVFASPADAVIHLAAAVSAECEADFDLGMRNNLETTLALLHAARRQSRSGGPVPVVFFSSSAAVYGPDAALPLPSLVTEVTLPTPQSSYGTQKYACEQLIADYTRKGFIDGRVARLMTVAVRPGKPNAAASGFFSGMVREPLAGTPSVVPVRLSQRVALSSPRSTVAGILKVAEAERGTGPGQLLGRLPVNLPALSISVEGMLATLRSVCGAEVADLVSFQPDPAVETLVASWPADFDNARAARLGLQPDPDFETIVRQYLTDHPDAVRGAGATGTRRTGVPKHRPGGQHGTVR